VNHPTLSVSGLFCDYIRRNISENFRTYQMSGGVSIEEVEQAIRNDVLVTHLV